MNRIEHHDPEGPGHFNRTGGGAFSEAYSPGVQQGFGEASPAVNGVGASGTLDFQQIDSATLQSALAHYNQSAAGLAASEITNQSYDASSIFHEGNSTRGNPSSLKTQYDSDITTSNPSSPIENCVVRPVEPIGTQPFPPVQNCVVRPVEPIGTEPFPPVQNCVVRPVEPIGTQPFPPVQNCVVRPVEPIGTEPFPPVQNCMVRPVEPIGTEPYPPIQNCAVSPVNPVQACAVRDPISTNPTEPPVYACYVKPVGPLNTL